MVFIATLYYLYIKLLKNDEFSNSLSDFQFNMKNSWIFILVFIMMLVNWSIEAQKWKLLLSSFNQISFRKAFAAVWAGVTINNWVPNRMAEFIGRILFINPENRGKAIVSTFAGSFAQMQMTLIFGSIGLFFIVDYNLQFNLIFPIAACVLSLVSLFFYFRMSSLISLIKHIRFLQFLLKYLEVLEQFSTKVLLSLVTLSFFRYLVYSSQYVLLLFLFKIDVDVSMMFYGVTLIFFIQTFIPSVLLTDIGVRGAAVLFVFENMSQNVAGLLAAAYSIWIINLLLPSFVGAFFILFKKKRTD